MLDKLKNKFFVELNVMAYRLHRDHPPAWELFQKAGNELKISLNLRLCFNVVNSGLTFFIKKPQSGSREMLGV